MLFSKIVLGFTGVAFAGYGLWCAIDPGVVAGYSGLVYGTPGAAIEARAMYGGLQTGFGLFLVWGAARDVLRVPALQVTLLVVGALALCRAIGIALEGADGYNTGAVLYELTTTLLAVVALRLEGRAGGAAALA